MSCLNVPSRSRAARIWPHVAVLALIGLAAAGCSDSARFDSNPFASNRQAPRRKRRPVRSPRARRRRVEAQPLPAPSRPATVAARSGVATGAQGLGAYRPGIAPTSPVRCPRIAPPPAPAGIGPGTAARRSRSVPAKRSRASRANTACRRPPSCETNGFREGACAAAGPARGHSALRLGRRDPCAAGRGAPQRQAGARAENVHIVEPGESTDRHRAQARRYARGLGARQQHQALCQGQHRRPPDHSGRSAASPRVPSAGAAGGAAAHGSGRRRSPACRRRARASRRPSRRCHRSCRQDRGSGRQHAVVPLAGEGPHHRRLRRQARTARRTTASIWRCRKARRSRPPRTASSPMPATSSRATATSC